MAMHNPPHPGGIVRRQCLDTLDLSAPDRHRMRQIALHNIDAAHRICVSVG